MNTDKSPTTGFLGGALSSFSGCDPNKRQGRMAEGGGSFFCPRGCSACGGSLLLEEKKSGGHRYIAVFGDKTQGVC